MTTLVIYKGIAALLIFLISIITVVYPLKRQTIREQESLELGEALASGIFLGVAFFHMLPESIATFNEHWSTVRYPVPEAICIGSFLFLLFLERLSFSTALFHPKIAVPVILTIILLIHSLIEGAALGIGGTVAEASMIFIAIMAHKGSASFALCVTLMRHQFSFRHILLIILCFSLMTPLGILLGTFLQLLTHGSQGEMLTAVFNAFAAGTFLYISILHHIRFHERKEESHGLLEFFCLFAGIFAMGIIAFWAP